MSRFQIDNPILNSPFREPDRHFRFGDHGITNEVNSGRRVSIYFMPIPKARKKGKQRLLDDDSAEERIEENRFINQIRERVSRWREGGYKYVTKTTGRRWIAGGVCSSARSRLWRPRST